MTVFIWIVLSVVLGFGCYWSASIASLATETQEDKKLKTALQFLSWFSFAVVMFFAIGLGRMLHV